MIGNHKFDWFRQAMNEWFLSGLKTIFFTERGASWIPDARPASLASASIGCLLHGTGTGTADELTFVNNHCPSIFLASPSRLTWLLAVQYGWPVAGSNDTSK